MKKIQIKRKLYSSPMRKAAEDSPRMMLLVI